MTLKKTDLVKQLAQKLDGKRKAAGVPARFAQGAAQVAAKDAGRADKSAKPKLVPLACRLPADLAARLRERAVQEDGGVNAVVQQAVECWLAQVDKA